MPEQATAIEVTPSQRVRGIGGYAFAEVDREVEKLRERGIEPIDFGVGDPTDPTPPLVREACKRAVDAHARSGYPSYVGSARFRAAASAWRGRRFGLASSVDPATEICSSIGSKEAIFHFAEGFIDPGDVAICPNPGYPPYYRGTLFAEGTPFPVPMRAEDDFLPDLEREVPADVARRARVVWINYPNSPSGKVAPREYLERCLAFARRHSLVLASDEAYSEIYFTPEPPPSILEVAGPRREGVVAFFSLSKRSAMTGYRVGFVAGDRRAIDVLKKVKTNIDSGTPSFVQDAAEAALADEAHVAEMRDEYRRRRDALCDGLAASGLRRCVPEGTLYVWQRVPDGMTSVAFAKRLLEEDVAVVCTPGAWIGSRTPDGRNPAEGYVRFALVAPLEQTKEAARRIARSFARA